MIVVVDDDDDEATSITIEGYLRFRRRLPVDFDYYDDNGDNKLTAGDDDEIINNNNKGLPTLRTWELNNNSTRWDKLLAAPSDEQLSKYWWSWTVIAIVVGIFSLLVFLSILSSKKARTNPFNVYLLYTLIPDYTFSLLCGITCLLNAVTGSYYSNWMCNFQQFYVVFGIGGNAWMNAVIAWQLHTMLQFSNQRRRYISPTCRQVSIQAILVYVYVCCLGVLGLIGADNWPFQSGPPSGLACIPIESSIKSAYFFWFIYFPLFAGIPLIYVTYAAIDVWRRKWLPPTGQRRLLAVYSGRLICVFWIMWLPTMILIFLFSTFVEPWAHFMGGTWSHLQGAVSAGVALLKPDILLSFQNFISCRCCHQDIDYGPRNTSTRSPQQLSSDGETQLQQRKRRSFMFGSTSFFMNLASIRNGSNNSNQQQQQQRDDISKQGSSAQFSIGDREEVSHSPSQRRRSSCSNGDDGGYFPNCGLLMDSIQEDSDDDDDDDDCNINDQDGMNEDCSSRNINKAISTGQQQRQQEEMSLEQAIEITAITDSDKRQLLLLQKKADEQGGGDNNTATRSDAAATSFLVEHGLQEANAAAIDAAGIEDCEGLRRQQHLPNVAVPNATAAANDDDCCGGKLSSGEVETTMMDDEDEFSLKDTGF